MQRGERYTEEHSHCFNELRERGGERGKEGVRE